jgi:hypothetical protein
MLHHHPPSSYSIMLHHHAPSLLHHHLNHHIYPHLHHALPPAADLAFGSVKTDITHSPWLNDKGHPCAVMTTSSCMQNKLTLWLLHHLGTFLKFWDQSLC